MSDVDIKGEYQTNYQYAQDYWASYLSSAQTYTLGASGYTWTTEERQQLAKEGREPIEFNITRRPIEYFSGYLRDNLKSIVYTGVENSDEETAKLFTELGLQIWDKGKGYREFLNAADEMFKAGMSLCGIQMDYSKDFINGDITFFKRTYNSFLLDPTFESITLEDCNFAITRDLINPSYAKQLLHKHVDTQVIDDIPYGFRDNKFLQYNPQFTNIINNRKIIAYDQYYRRTSRMRKFLIDERNDEYKDITDFDDEEMDRLELGLYRIGKFNDEAGLMGIDRESIPQVKIMSVERPFIELNVLLNGECVYSGEDGTGITETYPFAPLLCYFEPSVWMSEQRVQGIASSEWSNQRQFNKRHMKIIDMFDSVISTGYKYLIGSVPDVSDLQQAGQNKLIGVDPDNAPQGLDSVQQLVGGNVSPALIEYQKILDDLSLTLANVNQSVLGIDEGGNTQISGRLAQVRIAQGLTANRKVFDNIEDAQQVLGGLVMQCIQKKYPASKIERMLGRPPTDQFYEKQFEQYDATIKESVRSKTQKDLYYYELVNLKREGIVDVPEDEIIRALEMSGIDDLRESIERRQQQIAEQQEKVDAQERMALELGNAQKEQALSLAQERRARVVADLALSSERASEAEENRAQAALARAKTITEISNMEADKILKVLGFVNMLEQQEIADREAIDQKINSEANAINSETQGSFENQQMQAMQQYDQGSNNQLPDQL